MRKLVGYETKDYGVKVMKLVEIDMTSDEIKEQKKEHCKKIAEKFNINK